MPYTLLIKPHAAKQLVAIPAPEFGRIVAAIQGLPTTPRPTGCLKLHGQPGWRIRVGNYRVIYDIDDANQVVTVLRIRPRSSAY